MFDPKVITTTELPAIFISGVVPLPHTELRIDIANATNLNALKNCEQYRNYVVLIIQKGELSDDIINTKVAEYAVVARINMNMAVPKNIRRVRFEVIVRCKINEFMQVKPFSLVNFTTVPSFITDLDEQNVIVNKILEDLKENASKTSFEIRDNKQINIDWSNPEVASDVMPVILEFHLMIK